MACGSESALASSPEVWQAFQVFDGRWDERRRKIAGSFDDLATGFDMTRENFEKADADLSQSLAAGSSD